MSFWKDEGLANKPKNRRKKMSSIGLLKISVTILNWVLIFLTYIVYNASKPTPFHLYLLDEKYGKMATEVPNNSVLYYAFGLAVLALLLAVANIYLSVKFGRRKEDKMGFFLILSLVISLAIVSAFLFTL